MRETRTALMLYDGECSFCSRSVLFVLNRSGRNLKFCAMQSVQGRAMLKAWGWRDHNYETLAYLGDDKILIKSEAVTAIARHMGGPWRLVARAVGALPLFLRDGAYDLVALNRYRIMGRRKLCLTPSPNARSRFIV